MKHLSPYLRCEHVLFSIYIFLHLTFFMFSAFCIYLLYLFLILKACCILPSTRLKRQPAYVQTPPSNKTKTTTEASKPSFCYYVECVVGEYSDASFLNWDIKWQTVTCEVLLG